MKTNSGLIALNYIYLSPQHAGGKDQVGLNLLKGFQDSGDAKRMCVICFDYSCNIIKKISPDIRIIPLSAPKAANELQRMLNICFVNTFIIPRLIKKNNLSIIYHLNSNTGLKHYGIPSVVIPHDIKAVAHRVLANVKIPYYKYLLYKLMYNNDFKTNDYIIAISDADKHEITQFYPQYKDKIVRLYNPVDVSPASPCRNNAGRRYIAALNLQFHHKNIITLIKAFELIKDNTDVSLYLIGNVPKRVSYLKDYVITHHLNDRIVFTGFTDEATRNQLLENALLYVNPSLYEGFGMTAVEAIIKCVPTLLSDIPANREVTRGLCEYYYPPEDEHALADKLLSCLDKQYDPQLLFHSGTELYNTYNTTTICSEYVNFFDNILKQQN